MKKHYKQHNIKDICEFLEYSPQAYYQKKKRNVEERQMEVEFIVILFTHEARRDNPGLSGTSLWHQYMRANGTRYPIGRDRFKAILSKHDLTLRKHRKRTTPRTTDSGHPYRTYPNLTYDLIPDAPNQVWSSDITYIFIEHEDGTATPCFLSLLMDNYTKEILGHSVGSRLTTEYPLEALKEALKHLPKGEPHQLIHHSDRGVQYASQAYTNELKTNDIRISMTETGNPKENAQSERLNNTIKNELLKDRIFHSLQDVKRAVRKAVRVYNEERPHMSLGYLTPVEAREKTGALKKDWKSHREVAIKRSQENDNQHIE